MKKLFFYQIAVLFLFSLSILITGCSKKSDKPISDTWDIDKDGIPKFVKTNYIELNKIYRVSKFRSSYGHDYSDAFEHCRSMKHYFEPRSDVAWESIKIYCPVTGIITRIEEEWAGTKIEIASSDYPAFRFSIFHVSTLVEYHLNDKVTEGEQLGTHIGSQTMSDIAVIVNDPTKQGRMISYFEVITDVVFKEFSDRGVSKREDMIITKAARDSDPLSCSGEVFSSAGSIENWINLN